MKPAASPASSSPSMADVADVDGQRTEHDGRADAAARPQIDRAARHRAPARRASARLRIAERAIAGPPGLHDADVGQAARHRRDADVAAGPHVHLARDREAASVDARRFEIGADRPAARPGGMPRQAQAERQRRAPAVGRDRHPRAQLAFERMPARPARRRRGLRPPAHGGRRTPARTARRPRSRPATASSRDGGAAARGPPTPSG